MTRLITNFREFMQSDFRSLALGVTPSGNLHIGFLTTLACALLYLKKHRGTRLIITNLETSISSHKSKYSGISLYFQKIGEDGLVAPET